MQYKQTSRFNTNMYGWLHTASLWHSVYNQTSSLIILKKSFSISLFMFWCFNAPGFCSQQQKISRKHTLMSGTSPSAESVCSALFRLCSSQEHQIHPLSSIHWYYMSASIPIIIIPEVDYNWWNMQYWRNMWLALCECAWLNCKS